MEDQDQQELWNLIGYIMISDYRLNIMKLLYSQNMLPSQLSNSLKKPIGHISNLLRGLMERKLVICKSPNLKKGRFYSITELGIEVYKNILKLKTDKKQKKETNE